MNSHRPGLPGASHSTMAEHPSSSVPTPATPAGSAAEQLQALQRAYQDLLERHAAVQAEAQQQAAGQALARKELLSLLYTVSHDFRGPLNTIDGFNQLLERSLGPDASDRTRHYATRIKAGVKQMTALIDALLVLSRTSHAQMQVQTVDLSGLAHAILAGCAEREPERSNSLEIQEGITVQGDAALLSLAMQHLLDNAWKFSAGKALTRISFGRQTGKDQEAVYFVRDHGAGFDMGHADKLFGTFQRMHSADEFPGIGMGLALVSKIVARHGGRVWAEAQKDQGACFYFTLPGLESLSKS